MINLESIRENLANCRWVYDSAHAWLAVPTSSFPDAVNFGSGFGFIDDQRGIIYLEEDFEAFKFIESLLGEDFSALEVIPEEDSGDRSYVRDLPHNKAVLSYV